jgi:predicted metal-dependent phosphoesterase TrpH
MTRLRLAAVVVLLGGIAVSTIRDTTPSRQPVRVEGYDILSGDFHVHAFVGDGGLAPWVMQRQAARVGLDVIAVTNHNQTLAGRIGRWSSSGSEGPMILVGEEITGRDYHLIAVGIERAVNWDQPSAAAIDQVHAQGGVAIAAHPLRMFQGYDARALTSLDGLEAAHPDRLDGDLGVQFAEFYQRAIALNPEIAAIGSSDFHTTGPLGRCRSYLFVRERSASGVLDAIRDGRSVGRCGRGAFHGRPELVRLVEPYENALAPPPEDLWSALGTIAVWLALVVLALVGIRS